MPRVVSLIASATEIVAALGMEEHLVGRSHECDYPPSVLQLPVCTEPRIDVNGSSRDIDEQVKSSLKNAVSVYRVHEQVLRDVKPDVILTQIQCEVCAVSRKDVEAALYTWLENRPQIVSLEPNSLDDVWRDVERVATALGCEERGQVLIAKLKHRIEKIAVQAQGLERPTVACLEWTDPLMAAGNWVPELVELAGGVNLFGEAGKHSPWMTWEALLEKDPDILIAMPCGFDLARTRRELAALSTHPDWQRLRSVRENRVFVVDGNQYFNRPGPRLVESLEILAELLHPQSFHFDHQDTGWIPFRYQLA